MIELKYGKLQLELQNIVGQQNIKIDEPMKKHTTFKVGGDAKFLVTPTSIQDIKSVIEYLKDNGIKYYILGNGSNVLVRDSGIDGVVIKIASNFNSVDVTKEQITAQAGAFLSTIAQCALKNSLSGFEFASGIPGTLGGAIIMNAGAYGREMKDVVVDVDVLDDLGNIKTLTNEQLEFGYRTSKIASSNYVVLGAKIKLCSGDSKKIKEYMNELAQKRRQKQPLNYPSAGSTFKRPEGYFAAKLIEDAGLKGYSIGGAKVSDKHAGFIVNVGNATAQDILSLMEYVRDTVWQKFKVSLEPEIKTI